MCTVYGIIQAISFWNIQDMQNDLIRGFNNPKIKRLLGMNCHMINCPRELRVRIRYVTGKLNGWLGNKMLEMSRKQSRIKRGTLGIIAGKVIEKITEENLADLVVDGIGSFINWQKDKTIKKGIETLQARQEKLTGKVVQVSKNLPSVAGTTAEAIKDVWAKNFKQNVKIAALSKQLNQIRTDFISYGECLVDH